MNQIFLCLGCKKYSVFQAVYSDFSKNIHLSQVWTSLNSATVERIKFDFQPSVILLSETLSDEFKALFDGFNLVFLKKADFNFEDGKEILIEKCFKHDQFLANTSIDFSNQDLIGTCAAPVLYTHHTQPTSLRVEY